MEEVQISTGPLINKGARIEGELSFAGSLLGQPRIIIHTGQMGQTQSASGFFGRT